MMKFIEIVILLTFSYICDGVPIKLNGRWNGYMFSSNSIIHRQNRLHGSECVAPPCSFDAHVPGGIYTDLFGTENILKNDNDIRYRWIGNQSVAFSTNFLVDESFMEATDVILTFHGVDTFSTIYVNDDFVGNTSNMFLRYHYNVKAHLQLGYNEIKVIVQSPMQKANALFEEQTLNYVVPPKCPPEVYNGECHVNHIRKMQASFAWDWGPAFPSMGIWKDVELEAINKVSVTDVTVDVYKKDNTWEIIIKVFLLTATDQEAEALACNVFAEMKINSSTHFTNSSDTILEIREKSAIATVALIFPESDIERWWPNGYGEQKLYPLFVRTTVSNEINDRQFKIGFRTVELVQEPLASGLSFYFKINNVPIFAKGSNWIPSSVFPELSSKEETIRHLLKSARDVHMNMLRVWGGGYYESDLFYQIADEYGIMIWQDFMFACAMYPSTEPFLESVREEVKQNVRRLQHHPSVVVWGGNNENEVALYGNWYGTGKKEVYKQDYIKLYVGVIKTEVEKIDSTRPFLVSSPSDGLYTEEHNYFGPDPYSNLYGDVHYYNYIANGWNINQYPRTRFASEYGVESIPSIYTLVPAVSSLDDLRIDSEFMKHRQHLPGGYESMKSMVSKNLVIPGQNNTDDLIKYIYLTQVNQAVSIKIETESYRQARSSLNARGEGMSMGALYWQINDVWHAPSWSSIDFLGRWKMLHYHASEFFAPVIITPHVSAADELELYIVSDKLTTITDCIAVVSVYRWNSLTPIHVQNFTGITIPPNAAIMVLSVWLEDYLEQAGCGILASIKKNCVVELALMDKTKQLIAPYNYIYPMPLKDVTLPSANVSFRVNPNPVKGTASNAEDYTIELRSNKIALFVWLDIEDSRGGRFSENGFHMFHGIKRIVYQSENSTSAEKLSQTIRLITLSDIHNPPKKFRS